MYALRLVDRALGCSLCQAQIDAGGFVGYYYEQPLCRGCFAEAAPEVAKAWSAQTGGSGESLREIRDPAARCGRCGGQVGSWVAGFSGRMLLCRRCLGRVAPRLAAVLILDDGARGWSEAKGEAAEMARLAEGYVEVLEKKR